MPVRVRCPQCSKVLNAPDAARGKGVKCPDCSARVPVPAGDGEEASAKPAASSKAPPPVPAKKKKAAEDDDDFLGKLDLSRSEDRNANVCPKCGAEVDEEDTECDSCGIDLRTGALGKKAIKARMKGPDPADYFKNVWKEAWEFSKKNFDITLRLWMMVLMFAPAIWVLAAGTSVSLAHGHEVTLYAGIGVNTLLTLALYGLALHLNPKITSFTLSKKMKLDRTPLEFFSGMADGVSWVVWAAVALVPAAVILAPVYFSMKDGQPLPMYLALGGISAVWLGFIIPVTMAHRSMPVNWQIWVSPLLWKIALMNFVPVFYTMLVVVVTGLVPLALLAGDLAYARQFGYGVMAAFKIDPAGFTQATHVLMLAYLGFPSEGAPTTSLGTGAAIGVLIGWIVIKTLVSFVACCWAMYALKVFACFTYYHKKSLELITDVKEKKYVAKKQELGEDGQPVGKKTSKGVMVASGVLGTILFYVVLNVIVYFSTGGKYILVPRPIAVLLKIVDAAAQ